ncbi:hypothetical protein ILUMI_19663, partial [Ignelater luminosus]
MSDWQVSIRDRVRHFFYSKDLSDCQFQVGTGSSSQLFKVHKFIMAISSPVFEAMLFGLMANDRPILIEDIEPDVFETMLEYMYTDNVTLVSSDHCYELYYAAKKYMLPFLQKKCIEFLQSNINAENACRGYEFAKLFDEPSFMKQCLDFIKYQGTSVLTETSLKDVKLTTIITILDEDSLNVASEVTLFKAVEMCADNNDKDVTEST